uniref:Si946076e12 n=1 Tax=Arundo donax TaxID=35708 RepID=A0A0A9FVA1_ARUDO
MRILQKALAIDASTPIISNSMSSSVSRFISILKFLQNFSTGMLLSTPIAA